MKRYAWWSIALLLILAAASYAYFEYNRERGDSKSLEPAFVVNAKVILEEFERDEASSNKKYAAQDIVVAVDGTAKEVVVDERGNVTVWLGEMNSPSAIKCSMDPAYSKEAQTIRKGEPVTIKGNLNGYKSDELGIGAEIEMNFCVIEK